MKDRKPMVDGFLYKRTGFVSASTGFVAPFFHQLTKLHLHAVAYALEFSDPNINELCIDEMISTPCARNTNAAALVLLSTHAKATCIRWLNLTCILGVTIYLSAETKCSTRTRRNAAGACPCWV